MVLSHSSYNTAAERVFVCPLVLTEQVGTMPPPERFHTLSASPGYLAHGLALHLPLGALAQLVGEVETGALEACRDLLKATLTGGLRGAPA
ncbi:hypothetical protein LO763_22415 [Glycomyces sp. A-F 0318]|uniref:hypothetical protein n=1 Tax=Glycomyces amatae TaxID=2881355 RepID=UPI001E548E4F|nr:hypothetical protein [Glycomyces amatae]MCD0446373.1 hypothetical protein [Glycomyces amatae]